LSRDKRAIRLYSILKGISTVAKPTDIIKKKRAEAVSRIIGKGYLSSKRVYVGMATCEIAAGSKEVMEVFKNAITKDGLPDVYLSQKGCVGRCNLEPTVEVIEVGKNPVRYGKITPQRAQQIIDRHLKKGEVIKEWIID
jgi:NADP-reducing hydrogenase subunit HndB